MSKQAGFNYLENFYRTHHTRSSIVAAVEQVLAADDSMSVRELPFGTVLEWRDWSAIARHLGKSVRLLYSNAGFFAYRLDYTVQEGGRSVERFGRFFVMEHGQYTDVGIVLTLDSAEFFDRALIPFMNSLHPK